MTFSKKKSFQFSRRPFPRPPLPVSGMLPPRLASSATGGGLKWTRTTDLTLIRRAL